MGRMDGRIAMQLFFGAISIGMLIDLSSVSIDIQTVAIAALVIVAAIVSVRAWIVTRARAAARADTAAPVESTKWNW